jgi:hypothetical protein
LNAAVLPVGPNQVIEDGEHVAAVFDHTREHGAKMGLTLRILVPFCKHRRGHFDVAPQLVWGVASQEQAVEKSGLTLRKLEVRGDLRRHELYERGHSESAVYRKLPPRQVGLSSRCREPVNLAGYRTQY